MEFCGQMDQPDKAAQAVAGVYFCVVVGCGVVGGSSRGLLNSATQISTAPACATIILIQPTDLLSPLTLIVLTLS